MLREMGHRSVLIARLVLFECASYNSQRLSFGLFEEVPPLNTFEAFLHANVINQTVFCSGEKQGMLVNDECISWYNRVYDFLVSCSLE